ncbi:MAG: hydrolase 1, exosortase A system-associated [Hyphomicrobiales bacterium]|nr:hydrolase 1, exosortase A system-associated [Hyphomicrobiales bacterium]
MSREIPLVFPCAGDSLIGILHDPETPAARGVLLVVGGPQYRVGSHRQFLLLARHLADHGIPVLRMDYRGMGDSDGDYLGFEHVHDDIAAGVDALVAHCPQVAEVVLWGLCDAASANLFYAATDPRVAGVALLNPWVRTVEGEAKAYLRHYYVARLKDPEFWRKLASGGVNPATVLKSMAGLVARATGRGGEDPAPEEPSPAEGLPTVLMPAPPADAAPLPDRMLAAMAAFEGAVLLIVSGRDLTAKEFLDAAQASRGWRDLLAAPRVVRRDLEAADHTFSRREWRDRIAAWTLDWLKSW